MKQSQSPFSSYLNFDFTCFKGTFSRETCLSFIYESPFKDWKIMEETSQEWWKENAKERTYYKAICQMEVKGLAFVVVSNKKNLIYHLYKWKKRKRWKVMFHILQCWQEKFTNMLSHLFKILLLVLFVLISNFKKCQKNAHEKYKNFYQ